jgi:hypothetical protein
MAPVIRSSAKGCCGFASCCFENRRMDPPTRLATPRRPKPLRHSKLWSPVRALGRRALATLSPKGARAIVWWFSGWAVHLVHTQDCAEKLWSHDAGRSDPKTLLFAFLAGIGRKGQEFPLSRQWTASTQKREIRSTALAPLGERVASALRPRARTGLQSFEWRSGFGRRGVASRVRGLPHHFRNCKGRSRGILRPATFSHLLTTHAHPAVRSRRASHPPAIIGTP